ncbi:oligosaccharide flippase family protein [Candidatus Levibacter sp. Uisw_134_01]|uniref:lipopolysaccharide biosynthesis protein n=1 Tax=Candidatus Levibacter sp. Uisw_134_01 TaxID=3230999 RepID=UPI003D5680D1
MNRIKKNIVANFGGSLFTGVMSLIFLPVYINFLGIEAYGLVAIFTTILTMFAVLDMGLIQTLTRELARLAVLPDSAREMRDLLRTLEIPYIGIGLMIGITVYLIAPWLAHDWVNSQTLSVKSVESSVVIMGLIIAVQWPLGFYSGGLIGLQEQVILNLVNSIMALSRGLLSMLVLWQISATIEAFFWTQLIVSLAHILIVIYLLWTRLPTHCKRSRFRIKILSNIWRFATGIAGISLIGSLLLQLDKIILSKLLTLEVFGYYAIANVVSMNVYRLFGPVYSAIYPRLTNLITLGSEKDLADFYHKSAQLLAIVVFPVVAVLIFFSKELIQLWLQNQNLASATAPIISVLVIGTLINGILHIPYGLQLAAGWTSLALRFGILSVVIFGVLLLILTEYYGIDGAVWAWPIQQLLYFIFTIPLMHRRLLKKEQWRWYWSDVCFPMILSFTPVFIMWQLKPDIMGLIETLIYLSATYIFALIVLFIGLPIIRSHVKKFLYKKYGNSR